MTTTERPRREGMLPSDSCYGCLGTGYFVGFGMPPNAPCLHHADDCEPGGRCRPPCEHAETVPVTDGMRLEPGDALFARHPDTGHLVEYAVVTVGSSAGYVTARVVHPAFRGYVRGSARAINVNRRTVEVLA